MSLIIKIFLIEDWAKEPSQIRRFAWDTGLRFAELCEKVLNLYPTLIGSDLILKWKDEEGDWIDISSDTELLDAAKAVEGQLLKLWVSTEKKPNEPKDPWMDWHRELWSHRGGRGGWRGCRKSFAGKEHKITHWGYVCDGCEGSIVGSRFSCRECPNYDLCQNCLDLKVHKEHSFVEIRFPKRGRRGCSREMEKEFLESVGNGVAELLAPLDINVDVEVDERPTQPDEPMESKPEPKPEPELVPEPFSEPTAPSEPVQPNPNLSHPPAQFAPSDVMPGPFFYQHMGAFPPFHPVHHFPAHLSGVPPHPHPHPHPHFTPFYPPAQEFSFQIPEDMTPVQKKAMETLREMGFDISNSKLIEGVRKNGDNIQATVEEMLKK